jgi:hypothetical protein
MSKDRDKGLLAIIAKVKKERRFDNLEQLSDAERLRRLAESTAHILDGSGILGEIDSVDYSSALRAVACTLAIRRFPGPDKNETLAQAADLLDEIGLEFEPKQLHVVAASDAFSEFKKLWNCELIGNPERVFRVCASALEAGLVAEAA